MSNEVNYSPEPRPTPFTWPPSRNFDQNNNSGVLTSNGPNTFTQTWNSAGTTFDAIKVVITDTASATASSFFTAIRDGLTKFHIEKDSSVFIDRREQDTVGATIQTSKRGNISDASGTINVNTGVFQVRAQAWNTSAVVDVGRLQINAAETFGASAYSTFFRFFGALLGSATQVELFRVQPLAAGAAIQLMATQVLTNRQTGWTAATGTATRTTFATHAAQTISAVPTQGEVQNIDNSLVLVATRLKALLDDLLTHGLIGA